MDADALEMIGCERRRQVQKGFGYEHDDSHDDQSLLAAASWIINDIGNGTHQSDADENDPDAAWPEKLAVHVREKYGNDKMRRLVIAGALIVAEIERLDRLDPRSPEDRRADAEHPKARQEREAREEIESTLERHECG